MKESLYDLLLFALFIICLLVVINTDRVGITVAVGVILWTLGYVDGRREHGKDKK